MGAGEGREQHTSSEEAATQPASRSLPNKVLFPVPGGAPTTAATTRTDARGAAVSFLDADARAAAPWARGSAAAAAFHSSIVGLPMS